MLKTLTLAIAVGAFLLSAMLAMTGQNGNEAVAAGNAAPTETPIVSPTVSPPATPVEPTATPSPDMQYPKPIEPVPTPTL